jgi:hypothetical protein
MALKNKLLAKKRDAPKTSIPTGRSTSAGGVRKNLSPRRTRTTDVLEKLRLIQDEITAIEFLKRVTPDVSMAVWNFIKLSNQGNDMEFYDINNREKKIPELKAKWREFAARINEISNAGLDGLVDQIHLSAFMQGAMGIEIEVNSSRTDIVDVYPVEPKTITWELEKRNDREVWIPYQNLGWHNKVSLEKGKANFIWVPTDPDINDPRGTLVLSPVLQAVDFQMEIMEDLQAVLHHQGYPKNDISIDLERMLTMAPGEVRNNSKKLAEWLDDQWANIQNMFEKILPDDDYLHFDDITVNTNQGANAQRSLDVRAISQLVDVQTLSGVKQLAIFMNRNEGETETWGSVQFKIFCSGIASCQRGSKRLVENIAQLWLRVNGVQAIPKFEHNKLDWNSEEQRMTVKLMEEEYYAVAQLMGWIDGSKAASEVIGTDKAVGEPSESIRASFSSGGVNGGNDKHKRTGLLKNVLKFKNNHGKN